MEYRETRRCEYLHLIFMTSLIVMFWIDLGLLDRVHIPYIALFWFANELWWFKCLETRGVFGRP